MMLLLNKSSQQQLKQFQVVNKILDTVWATELLVCKLQPAPFLYEDNVVDLFTFFGYILMHVLPQATFASTSKVDFF
jgi:hypothetical protein